MPGSSLRRALHEARTAGLSALHGPTLPKRCEERFSLSPRPFAASGDSAEVTLNLGAYRQVVQGWQVPLHRCRNRIALQVLCKAKQLDRITLRSILGFGVARWHCAKPIGWDQARQGGRTLYSTLHVQSTPRLMTPGEPLALARQGMEARQPSASSPNCHGLVRSAVNVLEALTQR
jgi:hypothetical protein